MPVRPEHIPSRPLLEFLGRCYRFVAREWSHTDRIDLPDQGFEQRFRESCLRELRDWSIASEREFSLGAGLGTASGVGHEVDIIARHPSLIAVMEIKNWSGTSPGKNDVIVFFAKILDYLAANPTLIEEDVCLAFMSRNSFDSSGLAACLGLGIHPVTPELRPLPILIENSNLIQYELDQGLLATPDLVDRFDDYCALLNALSAGLNDTWLDNRCGFQTDNSLVLRAVIPGDTVAMSDQLRRANSECSELLEAFRTVKMRQGA